MLVPALLGAASVVAIAAAAPFFANWLGEGDVLFTQVNEGTAKAIMTGSSFSHFVMSLQGYHLNEPGETWYDSRFPDYEVVRDKPGVNYDTRGYISRKIGLYFVGLPPFRSVYDYHFAWNEMHNGKAWGRDEHTQIIYVTSFPYVLTLEAAETADRIPVTVLFQVSVRVVNPYKTLFDTENWLELVSAAMIGEARNYIGRRTYSELVSEGRGDSIEANSLFGECLRKLSERDENNKPGLHELYGVVIERGDIQSVDYVGNNPDFQKSAELPFVAENQAAATLRVAQAEAEATRLRADANSYQITKEGEATAGAISVRLASWGIGDPYISAIIAQTEAMASNGPGKTVIWANSPLIAGVSGLAEMLNSLGIKTPQQLKDALGSGKPAAGDDTTPQDS